MSNWFVYLLRCADDTLYCGITTDVDRRIREHNAGTGAKYTRPRLPVTLEAMTEIDSKGDALRVEILVKKQPRKCKVDYLVSRTWEAHLKRQKS